MEMLWRIWNQSQADQCNDRNQLANSAYTLASSLNVLKRQERPTELFVYVRSHLRRGEKKRAKTSP